MKRYDAFECSPLTYQLWDNKRGDFVREGHTWTKALIKKVKSLKKQGFRVCVLSNS